MNKIILLITLLCTTNIFAESIEDQVQRKMDMQTLSTGLEMVQKGILYNNPSLTKTGISMIKKGQKNLLNHMVKILKNIYQWIVLLHLSLQNLLQKEYKIILMNLQKI